MDLITDRRALHQIPELDRDLPETLSYLKAALAPLPCRVFSPAESALCAFFDFGRDHSLGFRADMDALAVPEATGLPFASRHPGRMHACGHDGHMAVVLELARRLARRRDLPHNVLLVFQPAEETTGGARPICESGVFAQFHTRAIFGLHLWPDLPAGTVASIPGGMMCRSSEVTLAVTGQTAHVAKAAQGRDALEAAARWYLGALDLERQLPPDEPRLLKFGVLRAGDVRNALAGSARLEGTLRAFRDPVFDRLRQALEDLARQVAAGTGCRLALTFSQGYPAVWNPPDLLARVEAVCPVSRLDRPALITEDFSWYQRTLPGLFFFLGCGPAPALHAPDFQFDERVLARGADLFTRIAEEF